MGDRRGVASVLGNLGNVAYERGDFTAALALSQEALAISRELGDRDGIASSLHSLGGVAYLQGDLASARALYLANRRELGDRLGIARALEGLAVVAASLGNSLRAARTWGAAQRLREEIGTPLSPTERSRYDQRGAAARAAVGDGAAFDRAWQEGRALTLKQAIELASEETAENSERLPAGRTRSLSER